MSSPSEIKACFQQIRDDFELAYKNDHGRSQGNVKAEAERFHRMQKCGLTIVENFALDVQRMADALQALAVNSANTKRKD